MSPVRACVCLKAQRLRWISCRSVSTNLSFILPGKVLVFSLARYHVSLFASPTDFSSQEVDYANSQVRVLLYPNCLNAQGSLECFELKILFLKADLFVSTTDGRSRGFTKTTLCDKQSFERVFPPSASKNVVAICQEVAIFFLFLHYFKSN